MKVLLALQQLLVGPPLLLQCFQAGVVGPQDFILDVVLVGSVTARDMRCADLLLVESNHSCVQCENTRLYVCKEQTFSALARGRGCRHRIILCNSEPR
jgi:hypothetical protein